MPNNLIESYASFKNAYQKLKEFVETDNALEIYQRIVGKHIHTLQKFIEKFDTKIL